MNNLRAAAVGIILFIIGLFAPRLTAAQGTLCVSNLSQTPTGSASIGSDAWIAQHFITGTDSDGYSLNSVQLLMNAASGGPSGFNVSIYSSPGNGAPGSSLGSLSGFDPAVGGLFTYTTSAIMLSPSTFYFVVVTAATPVSLGAYVWSAAQSFTQGSMHWVIDNDYFSSANGSTWTGIDRQNVFQLGIYATAVPEPTTLALAGLGLACLSLLRRRQ
jgi:hypothetical protein